jgi:hypothetical protein
LNGPNIAAITAMYLQFQYLIPPFKNNDYRMYIHVVNEIFTRSVLLKIRGYQIKKGMATIPYLLKRF